MFASLVLEQSSDEYEIDDNFLYIKNIMKPN